MGIIAMHIKAVTKTHGCDRKAAPGDANGGKLYGRCRRLDCPDCLFLDFVQTLRQKGISVGEAEFVHYAGAVTAEIVDDALTNTRKSGQFE